MYKPDRKLTQDTQAALDHECELLLLTLTREIPYSMYSHLEQRWIAVNWNRLENYRYLYSVSEEKRIYVQ